MPLIDHQGNPMVFSDKLKPVTQVDDPTAFDRSFPLISAALKTGNPYMALLSQQADIPEIYNQRYQSPDSVRPLEPGFDPVEQANAIGMGEDVVWLTQAKDQEQFDRLVAFINKGKKRNQIVQEAGFFGFPFVVAASLADPLIVAPAGAARKGFTMTKRMAMYAGGLATLQEGVFHLADPNRTGTESLVTISALTLVGGILGKTLDNMAAGLEPSSLKSMQKMADELDDRARWPEIVVKSPEGTSILTSKVDDSGNVIFTHDSWELARKGRGEGTEIGRPKRAVGGVEQNFREFSESVRQRTSASEATRATSETMNDAGFVSERAARGEVAHQSVESKAQRWRLQVLGGSMENRINHYVRYRNRLSGIEDTGGGRFAAAKIGLDDKIRGAKQQVESYAAGDITLRGAAKSAFTRVDDALTEAQFNEQVGIAVARAGAHEIPEVAEAAIFNAKHVFGDVFDEAVKVGLIDKSKVALNKSKAYLHRVYLSEKIMAEPERWDDMVREQLTAAIRAGEAAEAGRLKDIGKAATELTSEEIDKIVIGIRETITNSSVGRANYETISDMLKAELGVTVRGPLQDRTLGFIDDEILLSGGWLDTNIDTINRQYLRAVIPDVELHREFGSVNLKDQLDLIELDWDTRIKNRFINDPKKAGETDEVYKKRIAKFKKEMDKEKKRDLDGIMAGRDLVRGTYKSSANPNSLAIRTLEQMRNYNSIRLMGGAMISSMADLARASTVHGWKNAFGTGTALLKDGMQGIKMQADDARISGVFFEMLVDTRGNSMYEIADNFARGNAFERGLRSAVSTSMIANGLAPWNHAMKQWSHGVVSSKMLNTFVDFAKTGVAPTGRDLEAMLDLGISLEDAVAIAKKWKAHGASHRGVKIAQMGKWGNDAEATRLRNLFATAIAKDVDRVIITPGKLDKPLWMNKDIAKTILQFKSFAFAATNRALLSGLQNADQRTMNGWALAVALGMGVYASKQWLNDRPMGSLDDFVINGIDRAGVLGILADGHNTIERFTGWGIPRVFGADATTRYGHVGDIGVFAGASAGGVVDGLRVLLSPLDGKMSKGEWRSHQNMFPPSKFWYVQKMSNAIGEIVTQ